jgi:hypothetical protein
VLAVARELPGAEIGCGLGLVLAVPAVVCCAGISARRGGRLLREVLIAAVTTDPSGGGILLACWLVLWPAAAGGLVDLTVRAGRSGGVVPTVTSIGIAVAGTLAAVFLLRREFPD